MSNRVREVVGTRSESDLTTSQAPDADQCIVGRGGTPSIAAAVALRGGLSNSAIGRTLARQGPGDDEEELLDAGVPDQPSLPGGVRSDPIEQADEGSLPGAVRVHPVEVGSHAPIGGGSRGDAGALATPTPKPTPTPTPTPSPTPVTTSSAGGDATAVAPGHATTDSGGASASDIDWEAFWANDALNWARQAGEVTRVIPFVGIASGGAADVINGGQDLFGAHWQSEAPVTHTMIVFRSAVNTLNNGYGHVIYVAQLIQDALLPVAPELVPISATIIEGAEGVKVPIDLGQEVLDFLIEVLALYNSATASPPSAESEAWMQLAEGYFANVVTDFFTLILDAFDGLTAGAAQGSILNQIGNFLKAVGPAAKTFIMSAIGVLVGQWNVRGGGLVTGVRHGLVGSLDRSLARSTGGPPLSRQDDDMLSRAGWNLALLEFRKMRLGYDIGDAIVNHAANTIGDHAAAAEELATVLLDGQEPFEAVREAGLEVFEGMRTRLHMLGELQLFGTSAAEKTQQVVDTSNEARGALEQLEIPSVELPEVDLGEGVLASAGEALLGAGSDLAESGLEIVIDQARTALDVAKDVAGGALDEVEANADEIGLFLDILTDTAAQQITTLEQWLADFEAKFAQTTNFEDMFETFINEALAVAGIDADFDFEDIRQAWQDLGTWIDDMTEYAAARAAGTDPSMEPDVEGMEAVGSRLGAATPEEPVE